MHVEVMLNEKEAAYFVSLDPLNYIQTQQVATCLTTLTNRIGASNHVTLYLFVPVTTEYHRRLVDYVFHNVLPLHLLNGVMYARVSIGDKLV